MTSTAQRLEGRFENFRPSINRGWRYATYLVVIVADYGTGIVISRGMNLPILDLVVFSLTLAAFQFFAGKVLGLGLKRLDLMPERTQIEAGVGSAPGDSPDPAGGRVWVSKALVTMGVLAAVAIVAAVTASRKLAEEVTNKAAVGAARALDVIAAATAARNGTTVAPPIPVLMTHTATWIYFATATVALAGFYATLYWAMRSHPAAQRLELLEGRQRRAERRTDRAMRPLAAASVKASRALVLYQASVTEIGERLDRKVTEVEMPAWAGVFATAKKIEADHQECIETLEKCGADDRRASLIVVTSPEAA